MKYIVVVGDGMSDVPYESLSGKTPLGYADTPAMDTLARRGQIGMVETIPNGMSPGSDTANLSVMGYDPAQYYTGRSPFEAASIGLDLKDGDITFRCNFVTLTDEENYRDKTILDHGADEITTEEAEVLLNYLKPHIERDFISFYTGTSYRHIMVWNMAPETYILTPPHDILGQKIEKYLPSGPQGEFILDMMKKSYTLLKDHPVNTARVKRGLRPANSIWIWGEGKKPALPDFRSKYGLKGAVISAVDLIKGLGKCAGLDVIEVEGATGTLHTNYRGKAQACVNALKNGYDFVYLHVEAPDECGHRSELDNKIRAIEHIDGEIVSYIKAEMDKTGEPYRMLLTPDHPTPVTIRTHTADPVPFVIFDSGRTDSACKKCGYSEAAAKDSDMYFEKGHYLMDYFVNYGLGFYRSTRGKSPCVTASEAIINGIAPDGGLYIPCRTPLIDFALSDLAGKSYRETAYMVMRPFLPDFSKEELRYCIENAYDDKFTEVDIAPVSEVDGKYMLELYHGATIAFKDMALSILPYLMKTAAKKLHINREIVILTATSGDTGKAALEGFGNVEGTRIIVLYPAGGVSPVQERQMVSHKGNNTYVIGIRGNFDDAQSAAKALFGDRELAAELSGFAMFSSANSINIGRLIPQIVYYFHAYGQLLSRGAVKCGEKINIIVPTGNFGNILAAYYAKLMGLPVKKLICASNENKVLYEFFRTGRYDKNRDFITTVSPSMDILVSSNLERLLYLLCGSDSKRVRDLMKELSDTGVYTLEDYDREVFSLFYGETAAEEETLASIKELYENTGYLMDTHTSVAYSAYEKYRAVSGDTGTKAVIVSTASPYKFTKAVMTALDSKYQNENDFKLLKIMSEYTGIPIPPAVKGIEDRPVVHDTVCGKDEIRQIVRNIIIGKDSQ